jgi:GxxExxY protein
VYHKALEIELAAIGVAFTSNQPIPVIYKGQQIGNKPADMVIDNRFLVELLAQGREVGGAERAGLRSLLRAADMELGLIINFGERRLKDGLVRVLNPEKLNLPQTGDGEHEAHDAGFDHDAEGH